MEYYCIPGRFLTDMLTLTHSLGYQEHIRLRPMASHGEIAETRSRQWLTVDFNGNRA